LLEFKGKINCICSHGHRSLKKPSAEMGKRRCPG